MRESFPQASDYPQVHKMNYAEYSRPVESFAHRGVKVCEKRESEKVMHKAKCRKRAIESTLSKVFHTLNAACGKLIYTV
jgi:hypothetical protein